MTIYEKIVASLQEARVARNASGLKTIQTVLGEIERKIEGKVYADSDVTVVLKSLAKNWKESYAIAPTNDLAVELQYVLGFLPAELTEADLVMIKIKEKPANLGAFMKHLKENFPNQYDGKLARSVFEAE